MAIMTPELGDAGYAKFGEAWHNMGLEQQLAAMAGSGSGTPPPSTQWFDGLVGGQRTANQGYVWTRPDQTQAYITYTDDPGMLQQMLATYPGATPATGPELEWISTPDKGFGGIFDVIEKVGDAAGPGIVALPFLVAALAGAPGMSFWAGAGSAGAGQAELATLIESGTAGTAGAGLEAAAGISGAAGAGGFAPDAISEMIHAVNSTGSATATEAATKLGFPSIEAYLQNINPSWITPGFDVSVPGGGLGVPTQQNFLERLLSSFAGDGTPTATSFNSPLVGDLMPNINAQAAAELAGGPGVFGQVALQGPLSGGAFAQDDLWKKLMSKLAGGNIFQAGGGLLSTIASLYSANKGMKMAREIPGMTEAAMNRSDPFGPYRPQYAQQVTALDANPASVTSRPGYQFGFDQGTQALMRTMASRGMTGSGNEAIALQRFGQEYAGKALDAERRYLAQMAGANMGAGAGSLALAGNQQYVNLMSQALASLGYGLRGA